MFTAKPLSPSNHPLVTLTGVKPSGELHLGNLLGAIAPMAELAREPHRKTLVFVADLHALNTTPEPGQLREQTRSLVAAYMACGLDPYENPSVSLFRQSEVPAVPLLSVLLMNVCSKGELNRAHAYKSLVAANAMAGREPEAGVNMGLFTYPVLMASDILAFGAQQVPVGQDQRQHLEMAKDLSEAFARRYGEGILPLPEALVSETVGTLPGLDGRKMSKSYGNTIPLFASEKETSKLVKRIVTNSLTPEQSKDPDGCTLVKLLRQVAPGETVLEVERRYREGGIGYGEVKILLAASLNAYLRPCRERHLEILQSGAVEDALREGAREANVRAERTVARVMSAMGLR